MRKAKEMYLDKDLNMVWKYRMYANESKEFLIIRQPGEVSDLKLVGMEKKETTNYLVFEDEEGHKLYMTTGMFKEYLSEHPIEFKNIDWDIYKKGNIYSLHFN